MLSFNTEAEFRAKFPEAKQYAKTYDPDFPNIALFLNMDVFVNKPWGPGGAQVPVRVPWDTHVLMINTALGEVYPCELTEDSIPVGYTVAKHQQAIGGVSYKSEPIWAAYTNVPVTIQTKEGVFDHPAGGWLAFSDSKGLYYIKADKFETMGYSPV